ncbi:hypothetical protein [Wolbachia endosymbiont (group E) of Neria commutata]|uniref:hypothetical protein n=1 Tax=Wolbachia endosymbiont (group E) of Neria commutata TaxID=3066149 RepID=UPI003132DF84
MVHQIKLKNVASFSNDVSQENIKPKFYDITAENRDGTSSKLTLSNAYYIHDAVHHGGN